MSMALLQLAPEARDADAGALQLWRVFDKSASSIQDGTRLANIAWRLTYRDLPQHPHPPPQPQSHKPPSQVKPAKPGSLMGWPPTPESGNSTATSTSSASASSWPEDRVKEKRLAALIICDLIPPGLSSSLSELRGAANKGYPTPDSSTSSDGDEPTISVSPSLKREQKARIGVPRVVVLTPTPSLTPHPTPPATPLLAGVPGPGLTSSPSLSQSPVTAMELSPTPSMLGPHPPATPPSRQQEQQHQARPPPLPLPQLLPRSATRGMGSPMFLPPAPHTSNLVTSALPSGLGQTPPETQTQSAYAPQSTHLLPLGGRPSLAMSSPVRPRAEGQARGKFYLHAGAHSASRRSSHTTSRSSHSTSSRSEENEEEGEGRREGSSSESSRERDGSGGARGRGVRRGRVAQTQQVVPAQAEAQPHYSTEAVMQVAQGLLTASPTPISYSGPQAQEAPAQQRQMQRQAEEPGGVVPQEDIKKEKEKEKEEKLKRTASAPFLGGLEMTPAATVNGQLNAVNGNGNGYGQRPRHSRKASTGTVTDDARSVSSLATSSSQVHGHGTRARRGGSKPRPALHSRSRSRKGGTSLAAMAPLTNLAAATAFVERTMSTRKLRRVMISTSDDDEWSDDGDGDAEGEVESVVDGEGDGEWESVDASVEGGGAEVQGQGEEGGGTTEVEGEEDDGDGEGWEDESESPAQSRRGSVANAKAPPPSLQHGHARGHSTSGAAATTSAADLRQLPSRPLHRSASHLPALANGTNHAAAPRPTRFRTHTHTTSAQNARTDRALQATMSATTLSDVMNEAQYQRDLFAKAPRVSYENLTSLAGARPGGLSMLLRPPEQQQEREGGVPRRTRPVGGFGGIGLHMTPRPPSAAVDGSELSPIPPTPATAAVQQQGQSSQRQQQQQPRQPPPPPVQPASAAQPEASVQAAPPRRPGLPRALSTPHFGGAGTSGSLGKSSVAGPVVTGSTHAQPQMNGSAHGQVNGSAGTRAGVPAQGPAGGDGV
ncbi:hypothetical protein DFH07DRAFT_158070 [Mycena maculata]|uniref:Nitrogen regulatory protein areA GATA-like domain-containing protein n=1 Tax=Mycena maculata TaxID=230809 RepID=A0AAD7HZT3_9AGAR|nr:hypothetical protein DFH07DRAFT_158070 [Mycena maculata]